MALSGFGVWGSQLRTHDDPRTAALAAELEQLGYSARWFPAGAGNRAFEIGAALLRATSEVTVATGIVSIWSTPPDQAGAGFAAMDAVDLGRFVLGLGVSHAALVDRGDP